MIATMLVLGYRVSEVKERFSAWAPEIFKGRRGYFGNRFDARELTNRVRGIVSERTLESQDLLTGLTVVAKRTDTGSVWALANNRKLPFWNDGPTKGNKPEWRGNRYYKLEHLIRASTAAPYFFTPASIPIVEGEPDGQFVDGGVSPHNNPSLLLLMMAGINAYRLSWAMGDDNLLMISVGTGRYRVRLKKEGRGPGRVLPGFALDTFFLAREFERDDDELRRARRIAETIEKLLKGEIKLSSLMAKRHGRRSSRIGAFTVAPEVLIDNTLSNQFTVVEVSGLDRPGLLFELTNTLSDLNLDITSAHVTTFGEKVVDVFYVTDLTSKQVTSPQRQKAIKARLMDVLTAPGAQE